MNTKKQKVLVALSGGVDSSVAAALLLEQGYEVEGAFIITWQAPWLPCNWPEERRDAMRVAAHLHIPFHTVDLSKEYERDVVQYLVSEYRAGRTPNPDVMCNTYVKFGALFDWAMERGFDYVATGHYARVDTRESRVLSLEVRDGDTPVPTAYHALCTSVDTAKDQTYFLWTLTQRHLAHTLFPVGGYQKPEVRELAAKFGLPTAQKKDSQGVCFLGKIDMQEFLSHYIVPHPGDVLTPRGEKIGTHEGAAYYTLGQRHGFTIHHTTPTATPLYVVAKDMEANTLTVASHDFFTKDTPHHQRILLTEVNWISGVAPTLTSTLNTPYSCVARLRYRQPVFPVDVIHEGENVYIHPHTPQQYIPQGQSLVLYDQDVCLGGGVIG